MSEGHNEFIPSVRIFLFPLYKPAFKTVMAVTWRHWRHVRFLTSCPFPWMKTQKLGENVHFMLFMKILPIQMTVDMVIEQVFWQNFLLNSTWQNFLLNSIQVVLEKATFYEPGTKMWRSQTQSCHFVHRDSRSPPLVQVMACCLMGWHQAILGMGSAN